MRFSTLITALAIASLGEAAPKPTANQVNPFLGKSYYANSNYAKELAQTVKAFLKQGDLTNAGRTVTAALTGTFVWISSVSNLPLIDQAIKEARAEQALTGKPQIVQLVHYDLPDRDCSAGASSGEFTLDNDGLNKYKTTFVDPFAAAIAKAPDLTFAVVLEPDSLGNVITNQAVAECAAATPAYEQGIAYAITKLQFPNVALYIDAAHGGWLGWDGNLPLAAAEFAKVLSIATNFTTAAKKPAPSIRGFSTDVSNFNPYIANPRANYTQYSNAYDESHYATVLAPYLTAQGLPAHFIIDQGRSGLQNTRAEWGDWCNVLAGYGIRPTTNTNNTFVDSIVWVKPGGESDGPCGPAIGNETAPAAGQWWNAYAQELVVNANPVLPVASLSQLANI